MIINVIGEKAIGIGLGYEDGFGIGPRCGYCVNEASEFFGVEALGDFDIRGLA